MLRWLRKYVCFHKWQAFLDEDRELLLICAKCGAERYPDDEDTTGPRPRPVR